MRFRVWIWKVKIAWDELQIKKNNQMWAVYEKPSVGKLILYIEHLKMPLKLKWIGTCK